MSNIPTPVALSQMSTQTQRSPTVFAPPAAGSPQVFAVPSPAPTTVSPVPLGTTFTASPVPITAAPPTLRVATPAVAPLMMSPATAVSPLLASVSPTQQVVSATPLPMSPPPPVGSPTGGAVTALPVPTPRPVTQVSPLVVQAAAAEAPSPAIPAGSMLVGMNDYSPRPIGEITPRLIYPTAEAASLSSPVAGQDISDLLQSRGLTGRSYLNLPMEGKLGTSKIKVVTEDGDEAYLDVSENPQYSVTMPESSSMQMSYVSDTSQLVAKEVAQLNALGVRAEGIVMECGSAGICEIVKIKGKEGGALHVKRRMIDLSRKMKIDDGKSYPIIKLAAIKAMSKEETTSLIRGEVSRLRSYKLESQMTEFKDKRETLRSSAKALDEYKDVYDITQEEIKKTQKTIEDIRSSFKPFTELDASDRAKFIALNNNMAALTKLQTSSMATFQSIIDSPISPVLSEQVKAETVRLKTILPDIGKDISSTIV